MNSRNLTLLFAACFLISTYFNLDLWAQRSNLHATEEGAKADLEGEKRLFEALKKNVSAPGLNHADVGTIDDELVTFILTAKADLPAQMITLSAFSVSRGGSGQKGTAVPALFAPVPKTLGLKAASIKIVGKYKNLRLLQEYIRKIKSRPVVLNALSIEQDNFTLGINLIGK